jgi:hypothetical protein
VNEVFADTSLLVAFISDDDELHSAAADFLLKFEGRIVTTDWVLVELGNYLGKSRNRTAFVPFVKQLRADERFRIVPASDDLLAEGLELYDQRPDKQWSLTDCISFVVMKQAGIQQAMTADHHFEQAGFQALMRT